MPSSSLRTDGKRERERHDEANSRFSQNGEKRLKTSPMPIALSVPRIWRQKNKIRINDIYRQTHSRIHVPPTKTPISQLTIIKPHSESQSSRKNYITHVPIADIYGLQLLLLLLLLLYHHYHHHRHNHRRRRNVNYVKNLLKESMSTLNTWCGLNVSHRPLVCNCWHTNNLPYTTSPFVCCFLYSSQIIPVTKTKKNGMGGASSTYEGEVHTEFWRGGPTERDNLEVPGANRRRLLKWIFKK